jgi:hypothetical protein
VRSPVEALVERTEGWPAGIYLAALSLQSSPDRSEFVSRFSGENRHVVDFLVDEVLNHHDHDVQTLMLRSSILGRMCGPLCDAVLERREGFIVITGEVGAGTRLRPTPAGRRVLRGEADHVALNGIDRWVGGVHLHGTAAARWRWDEGTESVAATA